MPPISFSSVRRAPASTSTNGRARGRMAVRAADAGRFAGRAIERAVALALEGDVDGIVTAPIDKAALLAGGYAFPATRRCSRRTPDAESP